MIHNSSEAHTLCRGLFSEISVKLFFKAMSVSPRLKSTVLLLPPTFVDQNAKQISRKHFSSTVLLKRHRVSPCLTRPRPGAVAVRAIASVPDSGKMVKAYRVYEFGGPEVSLSLSLTNFLLFYLGFDLIV